MPTIEFNEDEIFIIPILWHGPNNQITSIKEALSVAHLVPGARLVLPDLEEHRFSDHAAHRMLSNELFDLDYLRAGNVSHALLHDLRRVWDGQLDILLYFRDDNFPAVRRLVNRHMALQAPEEDKWLRSPVSVQRGCDDDQVTELRAMLRPHRYVGMLCFDDFALQTSKLAATLLSDCGGDQCCGAYKERSVLLRKSPRLYQLAGDFIREAIGARNKFIAGHIRPMPDDCVDLWKLPDEVLDPKKLYDICRNNFIYTRIVPNLQALQRRYNTTTVFIMTHPVIRPRVFRMLQAGGINPIFIDIAQLNASLNSVARSSPQHLHTPLSNSLLAMVEEAVAAAATAFLGTAESSMTGMIVQERLARGSHAQHTYYMGNASHCADMPCDLPSFYRVDYATRLRTAEDRQRKSPALTDGAGEDDPTKERDGEEGRGGKRVEARPIRSSSFLRSLEGRGFGSRTGGRLGHRPGRGAAQWQGSSP